MEKLNVQVKTSIATENEFREIFFRVEELFPTDIGYLNCSPLHNNIEKSSCKVAYRRGFE